MFPDSIEQLIQHFRTIHGPDDCTEQSFAAAASISSMRLQAAQSQLSIPFLEVQWGLLFSDPVTYSLHYTGNGTINNSTCGVGRVNETDMLALHISYVVKSPLEWQEARQNYGDHRIEHATIPPIT